MKIELLTIGNELLDGQRADTNTVWIGEKLAAFGHRIQARQTVNDDEAAIKEAFLLASSRADLVISTGGLGPTQDDLTFSSVADALGVALVYHPEVEDHIQRLYAKQNLEYPPSNRRQAMLPEGAQILSNEYGTAPGIGHAFEGTQIFVLPGVPREMEAMFVQYVVPLLGDPVTHRFSLAFFGVAEAVMESNVIHALSKLGLTDRIRYSVTASFPRVTFVFYVSPDQKALEQTLEDYFFSQYSQYLCYFEKKSIEEHLVLTLKKRGWMLHTAESTSGGMVAATLVDVPGCSSVFAQGLVTYSNKSKQELLGVSSNTLAEHGAVSAQCALEMAQGLRSKYDADVAVSTTGIAGPDGGSDQKPVGRTYIAWVGPGFEEVQMYTFTGNRHTNRVRTTYHALLQLYQHINKV